MPKMHVIVPKYLPDLSYFPRLPFYFFLGPVIGGGDWQAKMCDLIGAHLKQDFLVAIPCRWNEQHRLAPCFLRGLQLGGRQTTWERKYLTHAGEVATFGCIVGYLHKQVEPRPPEMGVYARDSLGEIGELRGRMMHNRKLRFVLGADPGFDQNGISVMRQNFRDALGYDFPIHATMEETANAAIAMSFR